MMMLLLVINRFAIHMEGIIMPRPKGSKNKSRKVTVEVIDFAASIAEANERKAVLEAQKTDLEAIISEQKNQLKAINKELTSIVKTI